MGSTKNPQINPGAKSIIANAKLAGLNIINNNIDVPIPQPNNIKSNGLNKPNINNDLFELAGIK